MEAMKEKKSEEAKPGSTTNKVLGHLHECAHSQIVFSWIALEDTNHYQEHPPILKSLCVFLLLFLPYQLQ